jgi:hypothetical protein
MHLPTRNPLNDENYKVLKMKKTKKSKDYRVRSCYYFLLAKEEGKGGCGERA